MQLENLKAPGPERVWLVPLIATITVAIFFFGFARMFDGSFRGNDDTLYFYQMAVEQFHPGESAPLHNEILTYLGQQDNADVLLRRWNFRVNNATHYLVMNTAIYGASRVVRMFADGVKFDYALIISLSVALGVIVGAMIAAAILRWAIISSGDPILACGAALGMAIVSALSLFASKGTLLRPFAAALGGEEPSTLDSVAFLFKSFLVGGSEYSIFGYTPRSQLFLIGLAVFLLRWRGAWLASYGLTAALLLFHHSMGALFLAWLIAIDVIIRPSIFDLRIITICVLALGSALARGTILADLRLWPFVLAGVLLAGLIAALWFVRRQKLSFRLLDDLEERLLIPFRNRLNHLGPIGSDLTVAFSLCLMTIPAAIVMNHVGDPYSAVFFWSDLIPRSFAMLQPAFFVGLTILTIRWVRTWIAWDANWFYGAVLSLAALLAAPMAFRAATPAALGRATSEISQVSPYLGKPLPQLSTQAREAALHYAVAFQLDTGQNVLQPMLRRP